MLPDISNCSIDDFRDELLIQKEVRLSVLRLDKIHPVVSGNKLFKLHYFLEEAANTSHRTIITFGGAYSNHLVATAYACKEAGFKSIGIIRGERAVQLSLTLQQCFQYGMKLIFISRGEYENREDPLFLSTLRHDHGNCTIIPEGGYHPLGAKGASLIMNLVKEKDFTHVVTAVGTATTLAGLLLNMEEDQQLIGIPVLKGMIDIKERIFSLAGKYYLPSRLQVFTEYHFGGYAKRTIELINFMNRLWQDHQLPTDFVYTAKMMYGTLDRIRAGYFMPGARILCLHTGGLQGNLSLPVDSLFF